VTDPTAIAVAAVLYVSQRTGGQFPVELTGLPEEQVRRVVNAAARLVGAAAEPPQAPRHAAKPLD
jgi:hypothetical protein